MKHLFLLLFLCSLTASAQKLPKRPLTYLPADSVFILPQGDRNIVMDIMAVAPFIGPREITVSAADRKAAKRSGDALLDGLTAMERTTKSAQMLLLTGHGHYAEAMDRSYFSSLRTALTDDGILPQSEREAAAQQLLDLTGTVIATDRRRDVYVNLFENCVCRVNTGKFRMLLDIVSQYPDGPMVKLRINGLEGANVPFVLHIRVPETGAPDKFYINGHEIIRPVVRNGYLVIDRTWRNGEEVYFLLSSAAAF